MNSVGRVPVPRSFHRPSSAGGGQDAEVSAVGISGRAGAVRHPVYLVPVAGGPVCRARAETTDQLRWVDAVVLVEGIVVVARRRIECVVCVSARGASCWAASLGTARNSSPTSARTVT